MDFFEAHSSTILEFFKVAAPVLSAIFAGWAILTSSKWSKTNHAYNAELKIMEQACLELEHSYNVLTENGKNLPPKIDRLCWLESARAIERFLEFEADISFHDLKNLLASRKEHWRHRFYVVLSDPLLNNVGYFSGDNDKKIDDQSAFVVIKFSQWEAGQDDPLLKHSHLTTEDMLNRLDRMPASGFYYYLKAKKDGWPF